MIQFRPVRETWHCNACGAKNYGGEDADLFEFEVGSAYATQGVCLCRACALELATAISDELFEEATPQEGI